MLLIIGQEISPAVITQATKIFVNGCWVGIHRNPELLVRTLRQLRRQVNACRIEPISHAFQKIWNSRISWILPASQVDVNTEVGVVRDISLNELRLYTDYGRCSRPLFIVENQRLLIKKSDIRSLQQKVLSLQSSANIHPIFSLIMYQHNCSRILC